MSTGAEKCWKIENLIKASKGGKRARSLHCRVSGISEVRNMAHGGFQQVKEEKVGKELSRKITATGSEEKKPVKRYREKPKNRSIPIAGGENAATSVRSEVITRTGGDSSFLRFYSCLEVSIEVGGGSAWVFREEN